MATNTTLDEKFTIALKDASVASLFSSAGISDDSEKMVILRKLFLRSGYNSSEIINAMQALKNGTQIGHLVTRISNILNSDKEDLNTKSTIKFLKATVGDGVYGDLLHRAVDDNMPIAVPIQPLPAPISEDEDLTDTIIDACLNYSKTCMAFARMGFDTREKIRDELLTRYLK